MRESPISACVVRHNDSPKPRQRHDSVAWVDEIVVIDLGSADASAVAVDSGGANVVFHPRCPVVELSCGTVADPASSAGAVAPDRDERVPPGLVWALRGLAARSGIDAVVAQSTSRLSHWNRKHLLREELRS